METFNGLPSLVASLCDMGSFASSWPFIAFSDESIESSCLSDVERDVFERVNGPLEGLFDGVNGLSFFNSPHCLNL